MTRIIDISHPIYPGMPSYPGLPEPKFHTFFTHEESAARGTYAPGTTFQIATYEFGGNTSTYVDAPFHRHPNLPDLASVPIEKLANLPGILFTALVEGPIGPEYFANLYLAGKAVLVRTGWSTRWAGPDYFRSGPYLTAEACQHLVQSGAALVGIDCANIDNIADSARPAHTILLAAEIPIVEHLCDLDRLPTHGFRFFATPPAIQGGTSFPVRAFALVD